MKNAGPMRKSPYLASKAAVGLADTVCAKVIPDFFKRATFAPHGDQHVAKLHQSRPIAHFAVTRNDDGSVGARIHAFIHPADEAIDAAAGAVVQKRIMTVPPDVSDLQHVGVLEIDGKIRIGVARSVMSHHNGFAAEFHGFLVVDQDSRQAPDRGVAGKQITPLDDAGAGGSASSRCSPAPRS